MSAETEGELSGRELPLSGGMVAGATKVGLTVRRTMGYWSDAVHCLLAHLEQARFVGSPRFLGIDEKARETLSWIDGTAATRPWPTELLTDAGLAALTELLRSYHHAIADFVPPKNSRWAIGIAELKPGEIVCHGDPGPWNSIWRDGRPVALIDYDSAHPAPPLHDVAYLAWNAVPFRPDDIVQQAGFVAPPNRMRRLKVITQNYDVPEDVDLLDIVDEVMRLDVERIRALGRDGLEPWKSFLQLGQDRRTDADRDWLASFRRAAKR